MRLNDHMVVQQLTGTMDVVVLDEATANEVTIPFKDLGEFLGAISFFHFGFTAGLAAEEG